MDALPRTRFEILIENPNLKTLGRASYPFIWVRDKTNIETLNHERLHHKQSLELWIVGSWILYPYFKWRVKQNGWTGYEAWQHHPMEAELDKMDRTPYDRPRMGWKNYMYLLKEKKNGK